MSGQSTPQSGNNPFQLLSMCPALSTCCDPHHVSVQDVLLLLSESSSLFKQEMEAQSRNPPSTAQMVELKVRLRQPGSSLGVLTISLCCPPPALSEVWPNLAKASVAGPQLAPGNPLRRRVTLIYKNHPKHLTCTLYFTPLIQTCNGSMQTAWQPSLTEIKRAILL